MGKGSILPFDSERKSIRLTLIIAAVAVFLDQLAKMLVRRAVASGGAITVIEGWLHLTCLGNTGIAFGMLRGWNYAIIFFTNYAIVFIFMYYRQFRPTTWMRISLGLVVGGAIGNLVDRVIYGYVTDFILVRLRLSFNMADACVYAGAVMLVIGILMRNKEG